MTFIKDGGCAGREILSACARGVRQSEFWDFPSGKWLSLQSQHFWICWFEKNGDR